MLSHVVVSALLITAPNNQVTGKIYALILKKQNILFLLFTVVNRESESFCHVTKHKKCCRVPNINYTMPFHVNEVAYRSIFLY